MAPPESLYTHQYVHDTIHNYADREATMQMQTARDTRYIHISCFFCGVPSFWAPALAHLLCHVFAACARRRMSRVSIKERGKKNERITIIACVCGSRAQITEPASVFLCRHTHNFRGFASSGVDDDGRRFD